MLLLKKSHLNFLGAFLGQMSGLIGGGIFIYKFQPKATFLCIWTALGSLVMILGLVGVSYTSCSRAPWILPGDTLEECVQDCHCEVSDYNPICIQGTDLKCRFSLKLFNRLLRAPYFLGAPLALSSSKSAARFALSKKKIVKKMGNFFFVLNHQMAAMRPIYLC